MTENMCKWPPVRRNTRLPATIQEAPKGVATIEHVDRLVGLDADAKVPTSDNPGFCQVACRPRKGQTGFRL
jgi:hypothetical protein